MTAKAKYFEKVSICKNCGSSQIDKYCSNCGQKVYTRRFTLKSFFFVFLDAFSIEKGFIHTFKLLFLKPGVIINEYISGKTKKYFNPLKYVILIAGLFAFLIATTNVFDISYQSAKDVVHNNNELPKQAEEINQNNDKTALFENKMVEYLKKYINLIPLLLIPFTSLITKWFYRSKNLFYGEFLIINCFIFAQTFVITILFLIPLVLIIPFLASYYPLLSLFASITYLIYALHKTFTGSPIINVIKGFFIYVLGIVFFWLFIIIISVILLIILALLGINITELL